MDIWELLGFWGRASEGVVCGSLGGGGLSAVCRLQAVYRLPRLPSAPLPSALCALCTCALPSAAQIPPGGHGEPLWAMSRVLSGWVWTFDGGSGLRRPFCSGVLSAAFWGLSGRSLRWLFFYSKLNCGCRLLPSILPSLKQQPAPSKSPNLAFWLFPDPPNPQIWLFLNPLQARKFSFLAFTGPPPNTQIWLSRPAPKFGFSPRPLPGLLGHFSASSGPLRGLWGL